MPKSFNTTAFLPFPTRLTSTARAASNMPATFGRKIINMYARLDGAGEKRNGVQPASEVLPGTSIEKLLSYVLPSGEIQIIAYAKNRHFYKKESTGFWTQISTAPRSIDGTIRWAHHASKLIIVNGIDTPLSWDGTSLKRISERIIDLGANLTFINATTFTIESSVDFYPNNSVVHIKMNDGSAVVGTVASTSQSSSLIVTLNESILTNNLASVSFTKYPPPFAYVYSAHDRLWGFGKGPLRANFFADSVDRSRIYYTYGVNDETAWHNPSGNVQSFNIEDKMPTQDELVAMAVKDGLTVFFCRNHMQLWSGTNPTISGDFAWEKTIPLGAVHGNLVLEMPNDVAFFTRFGARTLSRTLQTEQLDVSDFGSEIDPTISTAIKTLLKNDTNYRKAEAFQFNPQGWFGFKTTDDCLIFQIQNNTSGWSIFNGAFSTGNAFVNTPDGHLYLALDNVVHKYDETTFDDAGKAIHTCWFMPWLNISSRFKKWANKYVSLLTEQSTPQELELKRYKNYDSSSARNFVIDAHTPPHYWDTAHWDEDLWDNANPQPNRVRDHYVADVFSYAVESNHTTGPLSLFGLKIFGSSER